MNRKRSKMMRSVIVAASCALSFAVPVYAEEGQNTVKISSQTLGHEYQMYQVFSGEVNTDSGGNTTLTGIAWGSSVDQAEERIAALAAELMNDAALGEYFADLDLTDTDGELAVAVAADLAAMDDQSAAAYAFANVINDYFTDAYDTADDNDAVEKTGDIGYEYVFTGVEDGYYLLKDKDNSITALDEGGSWKEDDTPSYTRYILYVFGNETVAAKADKPNIDKHIENPYYGETNDTDPELEKTEGYCIGDDITYRLDSKVPDMDGYDRYWYMVQDVLSEGLDFVRIEDIYVGDQEVLDADGEDTPGNYDYLYTLNLEEEYPMEGGTTGTRISIIFRDFCENYKDFFDPEDPDNSGRNITIRYTARLNAKANAGVGGNDNKVNLLYSNNPSVSYDGEPGPDSTENMGKTTSKKSVTYTARLKIRKVDALTRAALDDAHFTLSAEDEKFYVLEAVTDYAYTPDANGTYVMTGEDEFEEYDPAVHGEVETLYSREEKNHSIVVTTQEGESGDGAIRGVTDEDGYLLFTGLGAGTYTLEETKAPKGYSLLTDPLVITIAYHDPIDFADQSMSSLTVFDQPDQTDTASWTYCYTLNGVAMEETLEMKNGEAAEIVIEIPNTSSVLLPSTGGIGIRIFAVVGIGVMLGAIVVGYVRRKQAG